MYVLYHTSFFRVALAQVQEEQVDFSNYKPLLALDGKRILYWWGNTTDCRPIDGSTSCSVWRAIPASAMVLADDEPHYAASSGLPRGGSSPSTSYRVDPDARFSGGPRDIKTQVFDMDIRARYNHSNTSMQLDVGVVYQSLPNSGYPGTDLTRVANVHTFSSTRSLDSNLLFTRLTDFFFSTSLLNDSWSYAAAPGKYDSNTPRYSPFTKLRITDLDNDPSKPAVVLTTYGEGNLATQCPLIPHSWQDCKPLTNAGASNSPTIVSRLEVDGAYKGWGFESMSFMVTSQQNGGFWGINRANVLLAPVHNQSYDPVSNTWKGIWKDFSIDDFKSTLPTSENNTIDGIPDVGDLRALLVPDSPDLRYARLFVLVQANNNSAYNPVVEGSGLSMVNGGLLMCTARLDLNPFYPVAFGVPSSGQRATATQFASQLDCSTEWAVGRDGGYKVAKAKDVLLDRTYQSSPRFFNVHWAEGKNQVHVSYVSLNGAVSQIYASNADQGWTGQNSWININQGRSASCSNLLSRPPVPKTPENKDVPFWKKALTTVISLGRYSGGDFKTAFEDLGKAALEVQAELTCEVFTENPLVAIACGQAAAAAADQLIDAVDSKARHADESSSGGPDYKKLFEETTIKTSCHVGN